MSNKNISKKECHFDMSKEEGDLPVVKLGRSVLDRKRCNPSILIDTSIFRAPRKILEEKTHDPCDV